MLERGVDFSALESEEAAARTAQDEAAALAAEYYFREPRHAHSTVTSE